MNKQRRVILRTQVIPENNDMFESVLDSAQLVTADEGAGEVMFVSRTFVDALTQREEVEVLLMYPIDADEPGKYRAAAIPFKLSTFLNTARMLAIRHNMLMDIPREAKTSDNVLIETGTLTGKPN